MTASRPAAAARRPSAGRRRRLLGAVALLTAAGVLTACGGSEPSPAASAGSSGAAGPAAPDAPPAVEVAHVHGLGLDPADGVLLAGSHHGLYRLPDDGAPQRVADREQDFMGFTVVGPRHYLASGHPGPGQSAPSSLGLLESTDGGTTWESLSLAGEADFHALEARHGLVYGFDSLTGALLVSPDGRTWETRTSRVPLADFAVSPDDPDVLVATTREGPARSTDGGRTFSVVDGAPLLLLVDWADDGTLVGVAPDGAVHTSADGGTWSAQGRVGGAPQALETADGGRVVVAVDGAVLESGDGGRSFAVRHRTS